MTSPSFFVMNTPLDEPEAHGARGRSRNRQDPPGHGSALQGGFVRPAAVHGTVEAVRLNATNSNNVVTYPVWITVPNDELKLRPCMTASLQHRPLDGERRRARSEPGDCASGRTPKSTRRSASSRRRPAAGITGRPGSPETQRRGGATAATGRTPGAARRGARRGATRSRARPAAAARRQDAAPQAARQPARRQPAARSGRQPARVARRVRAARPGQGGRGGRGRAATSRNMTPEQRQAFDGALRRGGAARRRGGRAVAAAGGGRGGNRAAAAAATPGAARQRSQPAPPPVLASSRTPTRSTSCGRRLVRARHAGQRVEVGRQGPDGSEVLVAWA